MHITNTSDNYMVCSQNDGPLLVLDYIRHLILASTHMGTLIFGNYPYNLLEESIGSYLAPGTLDLCRKYALTYTTTLRTLLIGRGEVLSQQYACL